jgi:hypothetical protein
VERGSAAGSGSRRGYVVALVGALAFVGSCFLPYYDPGSLPMEAPTWSLFRTLTFNREGAFGSAGGFLTLFAGVATVAWISVAGFRGTRRWTPAALLAVTIAWSLTWIGSLMSLPGFLGPPRFGYWLLLLSIVVVVAGAIVVWTSSRRTSPTALPPADAVGATQPHMR